MKNKSVLFRILGYTKRHIFFLISALLCALLSVAATLYAPVVIGLSIDKIVAAKAVDFLTLKPLLLMLFCVVLIAAFFQWLMNFCTNIIAHKTLRDLRNDLFLKLQSLPLSYLDQTKSGDFMSRMINDIDQISDGLLQGFTKLFSGVITILGTICFMLSINFSIAILVIIITPLSLFVAAFIAKKVSKQFKEQAKIKGELSAHIEEAITGQSVIKLFSYENETDKKLYQIDEKLYNCGVKAQFFSSLTNPCTRFVNGIVYAGVGIFGAVNVINGNLSIGMLSTFLSYANQYTKPFNEISGVVTELTSALASASRIFAIFDSESEKNDKSALQMQNCKGDISIRNVDFSYSQNIPFIKNLNVSATSGQKIAIVGPTGCGKTTIINLLMRFYDVNSGEITVDGNDIRNLSRFDLRKSYGMVLQDTWLFNGTIAENIGYSKQNATREEIIKAAKMAHADSFIRRLEHGYDTIIAQDGDNISSGQKQLLCIARIMLFLPPMLILDEATSSIDTRTEQKIQKAFTALMKGRTSFVVAHRLSTIKEADCILVMNKGEIIEQGTHEELLQNGGFYFNLYNSQYSS